MLMECQNPDGGWPYQPGGPSWTEPTAYALMALVACGPAGATFERGLRWLRAVQRSDGGWAPHPAVKESHWVTALATMLGPRILGREAYRRGISWIVRQAGQETSVLSRVQQFLTGVAPGDPGWPWFPGTSAWVTPTALSMLALRQAMHCGDPAAIRARLDLGAAYLLGHACRDGGWNHGAARALGYAADSYPETTGVALLALHGRDTQEIRKACGRARVQLPGCRTSEGESWLRLGLLAHGRLAPDAPAATRPPRTVQNAALAILASAAGEGRNAFLGSAAGWIL